MRPPLPLPVQDGFSLLFGCRTTGAAHGRFTRAIQQRNLWAAEASLRELGHPSLEDALAYLDLLAEQKPEKLERACVRWQAALLSAGRSTSRSDDA
jgi:hypothetical protein